MEELSDAKFNELMRTQLLTPPREGFKPCIVVSDDPLPDKKWFAFFLTDTPLRGDIERRLLEQSGIEM